MRTIWHLLFRFSIFNDFDLVLWILTVTVRRVARNLQCGGAVLELETTSNDLDPDFDGCLIGLSRFLCPNIGDLQKQKQKRSSPKLRPFFCPDLGDLQKKKNRVSVWLEITSDPSSIFIANTIEGRAIFVFSAKIGLKSAKLGIFCILFRPIPPPWLRYW